MKHWRNRFGKRSENDVLHFSSDCLPRKNRDYQELEELLTRPDPQLVEFIKSIRGPLIILGAGGKMGPTLAVLAGAPLNWRGIS
jgi:hypothetical protein